MAFQTKNFLSIVASEINLVRTRSDTLTDFNVGSVNRTLIEANAQELDELYQQMVAGLVQAVPTATYRTFNFTKLTAQAAGGLVRVSITPQAAPVLIPAGSSLTATPTAASYVSKADVTILPGDSFADVAVVAAVVGVAGNLGANSAFVFSAVPAGFISARNLVAFINGTDDETEAQRRTRFNDFITTLARGTVNALIFGARDKAFLTDTDGNVIERVQFASVFEPWTADSTQPVGWVQVFVHNGTGGTSASLVARTKDVLFGYMDPLTGQRVPGYKAAGIRLDVTAATEVPVSLAATLKASSGYSGAALASAATSAVATYIGSLDIGQTFVEAQAVRIVMDMPGVVDFQIADPANVGATYSQKLMPGTLAISGA